MIVILGCVQPSYLAWIPLFARMAMSDVFVHLDDVEFSKNSFHNRNTIKTANGAVILTAPVRHTGNSKAFISDIPLDANQRWMEKHWRSIEMSYRRAAHFEELAPLIKPLYEREWKSLGDLNIALIETFKSFLGIKTPSYRSSEINVEGSGNLKLVNLCKKLGATSFIVKPGTADYHPPADFTPYGISFTHFAFSPFQYQQLYGDFLPNLSIVDFAMNCGPGSFPESNRLTNYPRS